MKESVTYQAIVEEGVEKGEKKGFQRGTLEEAKRMLLRVATRRFKAPPNPEQLQQLEAITDVGLLEELGERAVDARTWSELLASPSAPSTPSSKKRKKS